jgi:penicillin-binding protein 1A
VSVLDMAAAYATLANQGTAIEPTTIRSIELPNGATLKSQQEEVRSAVAPGNAYLITEVLQGVIERGTGTAAAIGRPAAGKTGTTNNYTDAWFVGYTPQLVTAVWVGYPQGLVPMTSVHGIRVYGGTFPAQIWRQFMLAAHQGVAVADFPYPRGNLATVKIDPETELLAASWCRGGEEWTMLAIRVPTEYCPEPPPEAEADPRANNRDEKGSDDAKDRGSEDKREEGKKKPDPKEEERPNDEPTPEPTPTQIGDD